MTWVEAIHLMECEKMSYLHKLETHFHQAQSLYLRAAILLTVDFNYIICINVGWKAFILKTYFPQWTEKKNLDLKFLKRDHDQQPCL